MRPYRLMRDEDKMNHGTGRERSSQGPFANIQIEQWDRYLPLTLVYDNVTVIFFRELTKYRSWRIL